MARCEATRRAKCRAWRDPENVTTWERVSHEYDEWEAHLPVCESAHLIELHARTPNTTPVFAFIFALQTRCRTVDTASFIHIVEPETHPIRKPA